MLAVNAAMMKFSMFFKTAVVVHSKKAPGRRAR
jgi:hypothetical protein